MSTPIYATADILKKYQDFAPNFDRRERINERTWAGDLRRRLVPKARGEVLEVAAGTGANFPYYSPECRITAVDLSPAMLEIAAGRARELGLSVSLRVMDAEALDFPDQSFDTVLSSLSTCTFNDPIAALREMSRVCRPDGRILLMEHGRSTSRLLRWLMERQAAGHAAVLACDWNRDPLDLVRRAGLRVVSARQRFFGILHLITASPGAASG